MEINSYHLILILLRTTIEFILTIYGYFKLNDTNYDKNFVTQTLDNLENSKLFRFLFISKRQINENIQSTELRPIVNSLSNSPNHMKYSKEPPPSTNIIIRIDRFISYRTDNLAGNTVIPSNVFFYIRTYKDIQYFVSEKSFTEFEKFLVSLKNKAYVNKSEIWDYVNNAKIQEEDLESSEKILPLISFLEDFLQILVNDPFYYSKTEVLYFLNIPKKKKKPTVLLLTPPRKYTKFIDMSPILTTSTNKSELYLKESLPFEIIEDGYSNENSALTKSFILRISALDYKQNSINNTVEFNFQITNLSHLPSKDWIISKTYTCFKNLNEDLENHLGVKIALFDSLVPKLSNYLYLNKPEFLNKRKEALLKYLEAIIKNINYHGEVLYNFLNFDAEKGNSNSSRNLFGYNNQSTKVNCVSAKILSGKLKNSLFGKYQEEIKFSYNFNYENDRKETILKKQQGILKL